MKASPSPSCRKLSVAVETYLDGELDPGQVVEVESHLSECATCRESISFGRAMRRSLQHATSRKAPAHLHARLCETMLDERERSKESAIERAHEDASMPIGFSVRYAVPLAAAACLALGFSLHNRASNPLDEQSRRASTTNASTGSAGAMGLDTLLEELVAQHAQPLPPEVTRQDDVRSFDPFVGVPVEAPKLPGRYGAVWLGGRLMPVRYNRAATMQYALPTGHRVTVSVYDPRRVSVRSGSLHERSFGNEAVFVGHVAGYNVAAAESRGVGYAIATDPDIDEPANIELVADVSTAAQLPRSHTPGVRPTAAAFEPRPWAFCRARRSPPLGPRHDFLAEAGASMREKPRHARPYLEVKMVAVGGVVIGRQNTIEELRVRRAAHQLA